MAVGVGTTLVLTAYGSPPEAAPATEVSDSQGDTRPEAAVASLTPADVAETYGSAVWKVESEGCDLAGFGSGFAIGPNQLVTNRHVVEFDPTPTLTSSDGTATVQGRVVGWSWSPDIAVIEITERLPEWLEWADSDTLRQGERLVALGFPVPAGDFSVTEAAIVSFVSEAGQRLAIRSDGALDRGNSGGPALTLDGRVAGVVTEMARNDGGLQRVPVIYTHDAVGATVEQLRMSGSTVNADCSAVGTGTRELPDWLPPDWFEDSVETAEPASPASPSSQSTTAFPATPAAPNVYGDDAALDGLWDACADGDFNACDELYYDSPSGSAYSTFGSTCGDREPETSGKCIFVQLDALRDACGSRDMAACDELYRTAFYGTDDKEFGSTCGGTREESFGRCMIFSYGDDVQLDALWDACADGDMDACDNLYNEAPAGTKYQEFGGTCGDRREGSSLGYCPELRATYGDDPVLDGFWDACEAADWRACDRLYFDSPSNSVYAEFGSTCGYRTSKTYGACEAFPPEGDA
jgi:hypothetical protein